MSLLHPILTWSSPAPDRFNVQASATSRRRFLDDAPSLALLDAEIAIENLSDDLETYRQMLSIALTQTHTLTCQNRELQARIYELLGHLRECRSHRPAA